MSAQLFLVQLRNLAVDRGDMDELIAAQAVCGTILAEYKRLEVQPPDWLGLKYDEIQTQVKLHYRDFVLRSARQARIKADTYKSREAKQQDAELEAKRWEEKLSKL